MLTTKEATPYSDPVIFVVSPQKLNFLGPYFEDDGGRLVRGWRGRYYKHLGLGLPVLPGGGPNNGSYNLKG